MTIKKIAADLNIEPKILEKESLKTYLFQKLRSIEADIFRIANKHGVKNIEEFDSKVKQGFFSEKDSWEDFFELDNLENERDKLLKILNNI